MPRKGNIKVRTGCLTCKKRKVKCDEIKPECRRCTDAGRKCDGYAAVKPGCISWEQLLGRLPSSTITLRSSPSATSDGVGSCEHRSLSFFREAVAPALCGPLDASFWTFTVSQRMHLEPAIYHAVLTISSLYENFGTVSPSMSPISGCSPTVMPEQNSVAIQHYNSAIKHLCCAAGDINTLLMSCILFTCIDFLRGEPISAITHSQHGIMLFNQGSTKVEPQIAEVLQYLSIYPHFFGGTLSTIPELRVVSSGPDLFEDIGTARKSLDWLLARTVRLVRASDYHRMKTGDEILPLSDVLEEQQCIIARLAAWWVGFSQLASAKNKAALLLETRWLACMIWTSCCASPHETIYDAHLDRFQRIVGLSRTMEQLSKPETESCHHRKFLFDMGTCPLLFFVVMKCRSLPLRIEALQLLRRLPYVRETLWDAHVLYGVGKRIIEVEHGLQLPDDAAIDKAKVQATFALPLDHKRVRDHALDLEIGPDILGPKRHRVRFFMLSDEGNTQQISDVAEW